VQALALSWRPDGLASHPIGWLQAGQVFEL
jgi:hypothetical protein